ncbi:hypothetical protein [Streptomyces rimosus]|uniref:hypothetical protein n=1 Tax=Streptomyces rimosus TaxID=1927 RepID=UPI0004BE8F88|nr:hypothetical protein [Streptomyces rimosus]
MPKKITVMNADLQAVTGITVSIDNNKTDSEGKVSGTVAVADSVAAGTYTITVSETEDSKVHASATLTVTAKPTPKLTVSPATAAAGGEAVSLAGTGFHASVDVTAESATVV